MKISKQKFVNILEQLKTASDLQDQIYELYRKSRDCIESDFMNVGALQINHEGIVVDLLELLTDDDGDYPDISYFIYELDYGRGYKPGSVTEEDGTEIDFSSAKKLYDYLEEKERLRNDN